MSLICPFCKTETKVIEVSGDPNKTGVIYRKRKCPNGHETFTIELPTDKTIANNGFYIAKKCRANAN